MNSIDLKSIYGVLLNCGFIRHPKKTNLFFVKELKDITPAFYCTVNRRQGKVRIGGGVGPFFPEFEAIWDSLLPNEDKSIDTTLPLIMLIDNFSKLIDVGVFKYYYISDLSASAKNIYRLASELPNSLDEFVNDLDKKLLLGKPVSDFLHIFDYHDSNNLYFRKSVSFIHWFIMAYPQFSQLLLRCLTDRQLQRLELR